MRSDSYSARVRARLGGDLPRRAEKLLFTDDGYETEEPGDVRWRDFPFYALEEIWQCDGAEEFARACRDELQLPRNLVDPATVPWEHTKEFLIREALSPLGDAFQHAQSLRPAESELRESWLRWEAHWRATEERHQLFVVLQNVEIGEDTLPLTDGITVQRLSAPLRQHLWRNTHSVFDILPLDAFMRANAVLRVDGTESRPRGTGAAPEIEKATRAILALRLTAPGVLLPVGLIHTVLEPIVAQPTALIQFQGAARPLVSSRSRRPAKVSRDNTSAAAETYLRLAKLGHVERMAGLEMPLRRFEQSYLRDWDEDVIIDLAISLESTLLADVNDELKYRLALRGSALLSRSRPAAGTKILLSQLYDLRSVIVHGGARLSDVAGTNRYKWLDVRAFMEAVEDIVRATLLAFVEPCDRNRSVVDVCKDLEDEIVRNLG